MDKIRLQRNIKRIEVNDSGECITLDFDDLNLPYRYYGMLKKLEKDRAKFAAEFAEKLKGKPDGDCTEELVNAERELNIYFRDAVDEVFGEGTCRKAYGDILPSLEMHMRFFDALRPYFEEEAERRRGRMNKYNAGRMGDVKHNS
ncbi:MAG: hypothetical protein NC299_17295 [Lachnospiraceae bacterium]|nr:hypothetical protein [Ruminococcus sp.]MCM1277087.1 hypothetical protein [Lachnospiraceae bacterium]